MHRLTVLNVAYPLARVGPDAVGGAEQVLSAIDQALVAAGHRSIVVATNGSVALGQLVDYPAAAEAQVLDTETVSQQRALVYQTIQHVLSDAMIDVVHMHGIDFDHYLPPPGPPVLATLHLPLEWYSERALAPTRPATWLNCVSATQSVTFEHNRRMLPVISNGVPFARLANLSVSKRNYLLTLGRICPEKGQHLALEVAHAACKTLLIGGEVFPYEAHRRYFDREVTPLLDQQRRYLGPLSFTRKRRLLSGAACLLVPSLAPETSSLVAMEAASCGTPVIAFRVGELPEVVEDGATGFLVDDVGEMVNALRRLGEIDPDTCRATAQRRFDVERMTDAYIRQYGELARHDAPSGG